MPRSRSRSPRRDRERPERDRPDRERSDRERERERPDRDRRRSRSRERRHRHRRSRSPRSRRSRSHSPRRRSRSASSGRSRSRERDGTEKVVKSSSHVADKPKVDREQLESMSKDEQDMMKLMGFSSFETTKNKKVEGNDIYVTNLMRKRRYRQYMNRRGGFNRPLDFIA